MAGDVNGTGNALDNSLSGSAGNNVLDGGGGADEMFGNAGNDTYIVDNAGDRVHEAFAHGVDLVKSWVSFNLGSGSSIENLTLNGSDDIDGTGNELRNVLTGNSGNNVLDGQGGADSMSGGAGDDTYVVDNAADAVHEELNAGTDTVLSSISYSLTANVESLTLTGTGNINAKGNALDNIVTGNDGNNTIDGGAGNDVLRGGDGNDTFVFDPTDAAEVSGGAGSDVLKFVGGGQALALTGKAGTIYTGLEAIDLTGTGNNSLSLSAQDVIDLSGTAHDLTVVGNAGDVINSSGQGWIQGVDETIGGVVYHSYTAGAATLHVAASVTQVVS
jgi:Ca2+-binding RTX toxin-like protein